MNVKTILLFFLVLFSINCPAQQKELKAHKKILMLMGSSFEITVVSENENLALNSIEAAINEVIHIENLISEWKENSETSEINRNAGIQAVKVSKELFDLIARSIKVSKLTEGAFDISFAAIDKVWKFDGTLTSLPTEEAIKQSVAKIGYEKIILDKEKSTVFLQEIGMKIGFGAIGQGYVANKASIILKQMGIQNALVNVSGDILTWGKDVDGKDWQIGIADPHQKEKIIAWLSVSNLAVVTSGDYEKFVMLDGKRYAHIINPKTGYPATGLKSVTIVCPDAELADALATGVFVMGEEKGMNLINRLKDVEGLLITDKNEIKTSKNLQVNFYKNNLEKPKNEK